MDERQLGGKEEVEEALKQWFTKVRQKDVRVTGPLLRQKAEDLAKKIGKDNFVATEGWFHRWKKRENISFVKPHGKQGEANHVAARTLPEHTYAFKNEKTRGTKTSKERLTILCCASMDGEKRKLLVIGKSKNPRCFKGVKNLPVDYTANSNAWMIKEIFTEWLIKWDNELHHDVLLLVDNCTAHVVTDLPSYMTQVINGLEWSQNESNKQRLLYVFFFNTNQIITVLRPVT
ncbi:tigger transposable element-derived protein 6-like [Sipha flava]|uniref:Tigger transposable element-derived protein 6-like n=1 Tax=Sipha flava TaxID=143950 RepID=A0A8B8G2S6_9HEMI|nr:tigger transposable element-derived protein 6-like [Sipha flava]